MVNCPMCKAPMHDADKDTYDKALGETAKYVPFSQISYVCENCKVLVIVLYI